jgi:hypothetical protein
MIHEPTLIKLLVAVIAFLVSLLCAGLAGFLRHLDGGSVPASLMRAGAAFGACLTVSGVAAAFVLDR